MQLLPDELKKVRTDHLLDDDEIRLLHCTLCGGWLRPHVLWFDEYYDEEYFRFDSSMARANETDVLIIVGTSGATTLPNQVALTVSSRGKTIIDINVEENPFSGLALGSPDGLFIQASSSDTLPRLVKLCTS